MSQLKRNVVANFIGKGWTAISSIVFAPFLIQFLGLEAYGLVGFNLTLNAVLFLLDMGLSTTLNREMAKLSARPEDAQQARNLVRTLEIVYWPIALLIAGGIAALAPLIATRWLPPSHLSPATVQNAVMMMGFSIALQWPYSLYEGGLLGLQKQVRLNGITTVVATVRTVGALLALKVFGKTVEVYFAWQILVSAGMTLAVTISLWRSLPASGQPARFDRKALTEVWRFAAGILGISAVSLILSQIDKALLSKYLTLDRFGCYTLAASIAGVLQLAVGPFFTALFPRFVQWITAGETDALTRQYHQGCQLVSVVILPLALLMILFSREILSLLEVWTHKPLLVNQTGLLLSVLAMGSACNALTNLPYALQLASGWTRLAFYQNVITIVVQVPLLIWLIGRYGAVGAALVWLLVNGAYVLVMIPIMHRRLLPGEQGRWYLQDVGWPLAMALLAASLSRLLLQEPAAPLPTLLRLFLIWCLTSLAALLAAPTARQLLLRPWKSKTS